MKIQYGIDSEITVNLIWFVGNQIWFEKPDGNRDHMAITAVKQILALSKP